MLFSGKGKERKKRKKDEQIADIWDDFSNVAAEFDVLGSYTGNPADDGFPEQDPDDL